MELQQILKADFLLLQRNGIPIRRYCYLIWVGILLLLVYLLPAAPTFNPTGGIFSAPITVTISPAQSWSDHSLYH